MAFNTGKNKSFVKDRFNLAPLPITADTIKGEVLYYFRYNRARCYMCCTEFQDPYSSFIEDIVVREERGTDVIYHSIEVKISEVDFNREFWHKKDKHKERGSGRFYDYFYLAIPKDLLGIVNEKLEVEMLPYGIFTISHDEQKNVVCELVRRPEKLERLETTKEADIDAALCQRMSSEVAAARRDIYKYKQGFEEIKRQLIMTANGIKTS